MIEVKTADLIGPALDWAVAKAIGLEEETLDPLTWECTAYPSGCYNYSTDWSQGGPLIDKYIGSLYRDWTLSETPTAVVEGTAHVAAGSTYLLALCRAIVAAKLGNTVQVPAELVTP